MVVITVTPKSEDCGHLWPAERYRMPRAPVECAVEISVTITLPIKGEKL